MTKEKRNMSTSNFALNLGEASWSNWTTKNAVSNGYKSNGWVYKAVSIISRQCASATWVVVDDQGNAQPQHHLSKLMANPGPSFSTYDLIELLVAWLQLTGKANLKAIKTLSSNETIELIPLSPDRIRPIPSDSNDSLIAGYKILDASGSWVTHEEYTTESVLYFRLLDPSDPIQGISPLQACARTVDVDNEQQKWSKSALENKGMVHSVFTFAEKLDAKAYDTIKSKLKEMFSKNKDGIGVVGSNAKYQRISLTPQEMDFLKSRSMNKEEIFAIFGVPLPLISSEAQTYSNLSSSLKVMWELTVFPIMDDLQSTLNSFFKDELNGLRLVYDTSNITALRKDQQEQIKLASSLFRMGVPMSQLNDKFSLGIQQYPGWEVSHVSTSRVGEEDEKK